MTSLDVVLANAGTPLMWAPVIHLLFGNLLLGVAEGWILGRVFNVGRLKAIGTMIVANYASSLVGALILPVLGDATRASLGPETLLYSLPLYLSILAIATFFATILLEWPFCLFLLWRRSKAVWKSLGATIAVHLLSYGVLLWFYLSASAVTLYTEVDVHEEFVPALAPTAEVLFVSPEDGDLYRISLNGSDRERVQSLEQPCHGLYAHLDTKSQTYRIRAKKGTEWIDLDLVFSATERKVAALEADAYRGEEPRDLREEAERDWEVWTDYWAWRGLFAMKGDSQFTVALDVPTVAWPARNATVLPGDLVVYQLGEQIVVLDLNRRKLGFLASGRCPLVLLKVATTASEAD